MQLRSTQHRHRFKFLVDTKNIDLEQKNVCPNSVQWYNRINLYNMNTKRLCTNIFKRDEKPNHGFIFTKNRIKIIGVPNTQTRTHACMQTKLKINTKKEANSQFYFSHILHHVLPVRIYRGKGIRKCIINSNKRALSNMH